jgi:hypothetical protein
MPAAALILSTAACGDSSDLEKSLRCWVEGLGLIMDRPMRRQDGRLIGCMVHNERLYFWLNQRAGASMQPENDEGIRLYWALSDIHILRDRLQRLGYAGSEVSRRLRPHGVLCDR